MTKQEFLDRLARALSGRVDSMIVNENISYYEEYIVTQIRMGKSEREVVQALGDPRLLARTISEAHQRAGSESVEEYTDVHNPYDKDYLKLKVPAWLTFIFVVFALFIVVAVIGRLFVMLLPVILVAFCLYLIHKK